MLHFQGKEKRSNTKNCQYPNVSLNPHCDVLPWGSLPDCLTPSLLDLGAQTVIYQSFSCNWPSQRTCLYYSYQVLQHTVVQKSITSSIQLFCPTSEPRISSANLLVEVWCCLQQYLLLPHEERTARLTFLQPKHLNK